MPATDAGLSLECEICSSTNYNCIGVLRACVPFLDSCTVVQSKRTLDPRLKPPYPNISNHAVIKRCIQATICNEDITTVNVGRGGMFVTKLSCCTEKCKRPVLPLPTLNRTFNGKQCPVCFSLGNSRCKPEEMVDCVGDQNYCLVISGRGNVGSPGTMETFADNVLDGDVAIQGCANKAFCDTFHEGVVHLATLEIAGVGTCEPAPDVDNSAPGLFEQFLPVLLGLLLVNMIF